MPRRREDAGEQDPQRRRFIVRLGQTIRQRRITLRLTQEQLADRVGISFKYLQQLEDGTSQPTAYILARLAIALDIPVATMVEAPGPMLKSRKYEAEVAEIAKLLDRTSPGVVGLVLHVTKSIVRYRRPTGRQKPK